MSMSFLEYFFSLPNSSFNENLRAIMLAEYKRSQNLKQLLFAKMHLYMVAYIYYTYDYVCFYRKRHFVVGKK